MGLRASEGNTGEQVGIESFRHLPRHQLALEPVHRQGKVRPVLLDGSDGQNGRVNVAAFKVEVG